MFYGVLNGETGSSALNHTRPIIINNWLAVQKAVDEYIKVVSE